jgi:acetyl esterase/lipase
LLGAGALIAAAPAPAAGPPSAHDIARAPAMSDVTVSPDGKHIAALTSPDGVNVFVSVWETANLQTPPKVLSSARMRLESVRFIKNDRLLVQAIQTFTAGEYKGHLSKPFITDLAGQKWSPVLPDNPTHSEEEAFDQATSSAEILSLLPADPQRILVRDTRQLANGDIYKVNVYTGAVERVDRAGDRFDGFQSDANGEIRARIETGYDNGRIYIAQQIKNPKTGAWEEHFRSYARDREIKSVAGFSPDPNIVYVRASQGADRTGLWEYDIAQRKFTEPVFQHKLFEVTGLIQSRIPGDLGRPLGFVYGAEHQRVFWVDPKLQAIARSLGTALGVRTATMQWIDPASGQTATIETDDGPGVQIISRSDDLSSVIVEKAGPDQPPEYYLLTGGTQLRLLGRGYPGLNPAALGTARMVQYKARDGLTIPAFLHLPPKDVYGEGPHPAIVLPHGGPWARDELDWDASGWPQFLASRGYVVIQPQFRGSDGWGSRLWLAGDKEWGGKMQDDNDDAARWLIDQHLAAPNRIALFGYSYGGYAAFAAAIRPNGLYQCAISGAGVAELKDFQGETEDSRFGREFQRPTIEGLDVLPHARETQIPMFIYGGDRDRIVNPNNPRRFADALKAAGKPHRYLLINDMGHTLDTWTPAMAETQLTEIEKYLKTECKPGGL